MSATIESVTTTRVALPMRAPVESRVANFSHQQFVLVAVAAGDQTGVYYVWTLRDWEADALETLILDLGRDLLGMPVDNAEEVPHVLRERLRLTGRLGLGNFAVAALDASLWDLRGRLASAPLWKMLGAASPEPVECYASGLFLSATIRELQTEAESYRRDGFRALKMRVGGGSLAEDLRRVRAVVEACDGDVSLAFDAVSALTPAEAVDYAAALQEFDTLWLEDPVDYEEGLRLEEMCGVRDRSPVPIASGEFAHGLLTLRAMVDRRAVDILMVDMQHVGGITPWIAAAEYAAGRNEVSSHVFPEAAVHLTSAFGWRLPMEYLDWSTRLFADAPKPVDGRLTPPSAPGLGVEPAYDRLRAHQTAPARSVTASRRPPPRP